MKHKGTFVKPFVLVKDHFPEWQKSHTKDEGISFCGGNLIEVLTVFLDLNFDIRQLVRSLYL